MQKSRSVCSGFFHVGSFILVGVGVLDDPTAQRQFGTLFEKRCAFFGGTSRTPSTTVLFALWNLLSVSEHLNRQFPGDFKEMIDQQLHIRVFLSAEPFA